MSRPVPTAATFAAAGNLQQQAHLIYTHPNFRFRTASWIANADSVKRAIIASFKSFGDEGQRLISDYLCKHGYHILFLTKDRVLIVETIKHGHPILSTTKSPDPAFIPGAPAAGIGGITCQNTGILSNDKSMIEIVKNTFELLQNAILDFNANNINLHNTLYPAGGPPGGPHIPACYTAAASTMASLLAFNITAVNYPLAAAVNVAAAAVNVAALAGGSVGGEPGDAAHTAALAAHTTAAAAASVAGIIGTAAGITGTDDIANKLVLNPLRTYTGIIKQISTSLKYSAYAINVSEIDNLITTQLKKACSIAISDKSTLKMINAIAQKKHLHHAFASITTLEYILTLLHNEIDYSKKVLKCHKIACNEMIKNIDAFINIINNNTITITAAAAAPTKFVIDETKRDEIVLHYNTMIKKINDQKIEFLKQAVKNLEAELNKKTIDNTSSRKSKFEIETTAEINELIREIDGIAKEIATTVGPLADATNTKVNAQGYLNVATKTLLDQKAIVTVTAAAAAAAAATPVKLMDKIKKAANTAVKVAAATASTVAKSLLSNFKQIREDMLIKSKVANEAWNVINTKITLLQLRTSDKLNELMRKKGSLIYKNHQKSRVTLEALKTHILDMIEKAETRGGKKSRQNKQQYHKKYTKKYNKKVYRKRSQKHFKVKRHKNTKKRNRK